jgi:hypothetical protein
VHSHGIERRENLGGEFTRWRNHERPRLASWFVEKVLQDWEEKGNGLSASGHRARENIPPFEGDWYCFSLDWSWALKAELFQTFLETRMELECGEWQSVAL